MSTEYRGKRGAILRSLRPLRSPRPVSGPISGDERGIAGDAGSGRIGRAHAAHMGSVLLPTRAGHKTG